MQGSFLLARRCQAPTAWEAVTPGTGVLNGNERLAGRFELFARGLCVFLGAKAPFLLATAGVRSFPL